MPAGIPGVRSVEPYLYISIAPSLKLFVLLEFFAWCEIFVKPGMSVHLLFVLLLQTLHKN